MSGETLTPLVVRRAASSPGCQASLPAGHNRHVARGAFRGGRRWVAVAVSPMNVKICIYIVYYVDRLCFWKRSDYRINYYLLLLMDQILPTVAKDPMNYSVLSIPVCAGFSTSTIPLRFPIFRRFA